MKRHGFSMSAGVLAALVAAPLGWATESVHPITHRPPTLSASAHTQAAASSEAAAKKNVGKLKGTLTAITLDKSPSLTVNTADGQTRTFAIDADSTGFWIGGKELKLNAAHRKEVETKVVAGQSVSIRYAARGSQQVARAVTLQP